MTSVKAKDRKTRSHRLTRYKDGSHESIGVHNKRAKAMQFLLPLLLLLIINICSCSVINISRYPDGTKFVQDKRIKNSENMPNVSLSVINTGEFRQIEAFLNSSGSLFKKVSASLPCVIVKHPQGTILFDSGLGENVDRDFNEAMPFGTGFTFPYRLKETARAQMQKSGTMNPDSIKTIIISHLHCDHASGIEDFPNAVIWTTNTEYNYAIKTMGRGVSRSIFDNEKIKWRFIHLQNKPYENFDKSLDVFGDGSVVLVSMPGHTPGHMGMFVNMKSGKRFLFIGDATLYSDDAKIPARPWAEKLFVDADKNQTDETIVRINRLMQKYPNLVILSSHDNPDKYTGFLFPRFIK